MPSKRVSLKGKGADLFFGEYAPPNQLAADPTDGQAVPLLAAAESIVLPHPPQGNTPDAAVAVDSPVKTERSPRRAARRPQARPAAAPASKIASTIASSEESNVSEVIEAIRKVVKIPGREVSYVRLTPEEKAQLTDVVYTCKRRGMKTTETEINRIAINYLLHDYHEHGEQSVLALVLAVLLA